MGEFPTALQFYIYIKRIKLYRETRGTYIDTSGREEREIKKLKALYNCM